MKKLYITIPAGYLDTMNAVLDNHDIRHRWPDLPTKAGLTTLSLLVSDDAAMHMLDAVEKSMAAAEQASLQIINIDASFPGDNGNAAAEATGTPRRSRYELTQLAHEQARADGIYPLLVCLSTLVASIGLLDDNSAVVIGGMVIAPLLGPNLALSLAIALDLKTLVRTALRTLAIGATLAFGLAFLVGLFAPIDELNRELSLRTQTGSASAVLAAASGCAAVLSTTRGVASVLVGVMVAVALVPPLATAGLVLAAGQWTAAGAALILFGVNVSAINLSAQLTLLFSDISPRTDALISGARKTSVTAILIWTALLVALLAIPILLAQYH